ncbi:MAG: zinc ribbon domain-containing protein [Oscillospiraceae bacterium]|nr:zinc ribbon domain-containing protein [Oscillospiraceae bacterium]
MPFFEEIGKKITDFGQTAVEKTKSSTESIRLKNMIREEQRHCKELYQQIGELYVQQFGSHPEPVFAQMIQEVQNSQIRIQSYQNQIQQTKEFASSTGDSVVCQQCGASLPANTIFCNQCGAKVESPATWTCPSCGKTLSVEFAFCDQCGQKRP